jgi:hypothetical protein
MAFRLTAVESRDLTTVRLVGRVGDDAITPLLDTCGRARRPIVLDLSQVTGASEAGVLLLRRLTDEGVPGRSAPPAASREAAGSAGGNEARSADTPLMKPSLPE